MKSLILLRGAPGSGKSAFISSNNLEEVTISSDDIRLKIAGLKVNDSSKIVINQDLNKEVFEILFSILEIRLKQGLTTIIDATNCNNKYLKEYKNLAEKYDFNLFSVNFNSTYEELIKRNEQRPEFKQVDTSIILKFYTDLKNNPNPKWIKEISQQEALNLFKIEKIDLSVYENVYFIGDIQGVHNPLDLFLKNEFNDNSFYIFIGDYLDRGPDNHLVISKLLEIRNNRNVLFLEGNHETHLKNWALGLDIHSREFNSKTKIQLEENNISKKEVVDFTKKLKKLVLIQYNEKEILVSHCGTYKFLNDTKNISLKQFSHSREYDIDVDKVFHSNTSENQYQVHGHRNKLNISIDQYRSFNLEGKVEYGGDLRILNLSKEGFKSILLKNNDSNIQKNETRTFSTIEELETSGFVRKVDLGNNIFSYNFTRNAFYQKKWNSLTTKARGLFINKDDNSIIARSYEKFFNLNEFPWLNIENISENKISFPVSFWIKENGFLGILSYNPKENDLFIASKSSNKSDFAGYFKEILLDHIKDKKNELTSFIKENNVSLVFEVIDVKNDPHIIRYESNQVILLDVIRNEFSFKNDYKLLNDAQNKFDFKIKSLGYTAQNKEEFLLIMNKITDPDYKHGNNYIEGFVVESANGFMFKVKNGYYSYWKKIRGILERFNSGKNIDNSQMDLIKEIIEKGLEKKEIVDIQLKLSK